MKYGSRAECLLNKTVEETISLAMPRGKPGFLHAQKSMRPFIQSMYGIIVFCLLSILSAIEANASGIVARNPELQSEGHVYQLSADFEIDFNPRLEEAVKKGITLSFIVDFELIRPRWYWFNKEVVQTSKLLQLSYHALTRQYRLSSGGLSQSFSSLNDALHVMSRLRHWPVLEKEDIEPGQTYQAAVRMRFDLTQLPKTLQVYALSNRDWNLPSEWTQWPFALDKTETAASLSDAPEENAIHGDAVPPEHESIPPLTGEAK